MTDTDVTWQSTAAYLYVLMLDNPALAWEYLRRDPAYRALWPPQGSSLSTPIGSKWGLQFRRGPDPRCPRRAAVLDACAGGPHPNRARQLRRAPCTILAVGDPGS
ncbi:MAG: DUF6499 domain-containing protein [Gammaproteobacteria bacterium]